MKEQSGVIYILTNPSFPEYVKIGYADDVNARLKQLNNSECIPFAFRIYATYGHYQLISDFVLDCVFKKEMIIITGADDVAAELRRIGNNVNQLARAVNAGFVSQINLTDTRKELEKIWQSLNSLLRVAQ